jgi:hypothetical protein
MVMDNVHAVAWTNIYADIVQIAESDWQWDQKIKQRQSDRSRRYKKFLKKVSNETEGQDFYVVSSEYDTPPSGKKEPRRIARKRVAEYLDYGMTNPTEDELREMFAREERKSKVNFLFAKFLSYSYISHNFLYIQQFIQYSHNFIFIC